MMKTTLGPHFREKAEHDLSYEIKKMLSVLWENHHLTELQWSFCLKQPENKRCWKCRRATLGLSRGQLGRSSYTHDTSVTSMWRFCFLFPNSEREWCYGDFFFCLPHDIALQLSTFQVSLASMHVFLNLLSYSLSGRQEFGTYGDGKVQFLGPPSGTISPCPPPSFKKTGSRYTSIALLPLLLQHYYSIAMCLQCNAAVTIYPQPVFFRKNSPEVEREKVSPHISSFLPPTQCEAAGAFENVTAFTVAVGT